MNQQPTIVKNMMEGRCFWRITDIYSKCSSDYDKNSKTTCTFIKIRKQFV